MNAPTVQEIIDSVRRTGHTLSLGPGNTLLLDGAPQPPGHGRYLVWQHAREIAAHLAATQPPATPTARAGVLEAGAAKATRERDVAPALTVSPRPGRAPGSGPVPTGEQQAAIEAFTAGENLVLEAGAGAGKTSTLKMLAATKPRQRGIYVAYNKAIAGDAKKSFPANVSCATAHAVAFRAVGRPYGPRIFDAPRQVAREAARILRINDPVKVEEILLAPHQIARLAIGTVRRFCMSADLEPELWHVPAPTGLDAPAQRRALAQILLPLARRAWDQELVPLNGRLKFEHDYYLKLWQLTNPRLGVDFVMLDEAQDANPVIASVVDRQTDAQRVLVGDRNQAIYGWRGAIDAMSRFTGTRLTLSQSFRFGPAIATEANKWLELLEAPLRIRGFEAIDSRVAPVDAPLAILCRSNAGAVTALMQAAGAGRKAALVGGGGEIKKLAQAALELKAGQGTSHAELFVFTSWSQVQEYAEQDESGSDLRVFVRLIDEYGPQAVIATVDRLVDETDADVAVSTAHKAKGREWATVKIHDDFRQPKPDPISGERPLPDPAERMLAYVAVTRAREVLDRDGLAWVDGYFGAPEVRRG